MIFLLQGMLPILLSEIVEKTKFIPQGFGMVANNLLIPIAIMSSFFSVASMTIGIGFVFGSVVRFRQRRRNYMAHPLSTVLTLFFSGIFLLLLPLIYHLTESGIPTSLYS